MWDTEAVSFRVIPGISADTVPFWCCKCGCDGRIVRRPRSCFVPRSRLCHWSTAVVTLRERKTRVVPPADEVEHLASIPRVRGVQARTSQSCSASWLACSSVGARAMPQDGVGRLEGQSATTMTSANTVEWPSASITIADNGTRFRFVTVALSWITRFCACHSAEDSSHTGGSDQFVRSRSLFLENFQ